MPGWHVSQRFVNAEGFPIVLIPPPPPALQEEEEEVVVVVVEAGEEDSLLKVMKDCLSAEAKDVGDVRQDKTSSTSSEASLSHVPRPSNHPRTQRPTRAPV